MDGYCLYYYELLCLYLAAKLVLLAERVPTISGSGEGLSAPPQPTTTIHGAQNRSVHNYAKDRKLFKRDLFQMYVYIPHFYQNV